jgi:hypothetical protein
VDTVELVGVDQRVWDVRSRQKEGQLDGDARLPDAGSPADDRDMSAQSASK